MQPFDWRDFLTLAESLGQDAASVRTAISRAYYAAFHRARLYVEQQIGESVSRTGRAHEDVWRVLKDPRRTKPEKSAAQHGERLKRWRTTADYNASASVEQLRHERQFAIRAAHAVVSKLA